MELRKVVQISFTDTNGEEVKVGDNVVYTSNGSEASVVASFHGYTKRGALVLRNVMTGKTYNVMPQTIKALIVLHGFDLE